MQLWNQHGWLTAKIYHTDVKKEKQETQTRNKKKEKGKRKKEKRKKKKEKGRGKGRDKIKQRTWHDDMTWWHHIIRSKWDLNKI